MPQTYQVTITLSNKQISVAPDEVTAQRGDTVNFTCNANSWAVQFIAEGAPDSSTRRNANEAVQPTAVHGFAGGSASIRVKNNAPDHTEWDYVIAVYDEESGEVITKDPDIVVGGRPGG
jgi:plastocyanin